MYWLEEHASAYHFNSDYEFRGELSDDEFKNLDFDKLWDLVAPDLKGLIKNYLEAYNGTDGNQVWSCDGNYEVRSE